MKADFRKKNANRETVSMENASSSSHIRCFRQNFYHPFCTIEIFLPSGKHFVTMQFEGRREKFLLTSEFNFYLDESHCCVNLFLERQKYDLERFLTLTSIALLSFIVQ